jgi:NTP pyrophosphatase (non-canonical NTP hydrolase)
MKSLTQLQAEVGEWAKKNFGDQPSYRQILGAMEELGELAHAQLKSEQGIRGSQEKHDADAKDAVADVVIYLVDYCYRRGWDFHVILFETWEVVKNRDWKKNPETGTGSKS